MKCALRLSLCLGRTDLALPMLLSGILFSAIDPPFGATAFGFKTPSLISRRAQSVNLG